MEKILFPAANFQDIKLSFKKEGVVQSTSDLSVSFGKMIHSDIRSYSEDCDSPETIIESFDEQFLSVLFEGKRGVPVVNILQHTTFVDDFGRTFEIPRVTWQLQDVPPTRLSREHWEIIRLALL